MKDWLAWHEAYDDPESSLAVRLRVVSAHLSAALDAAPAGPLTVVSLCAGQGHDVLGVLPGHARRADVTAVLVEADPRNAAIAQQRAARAGLSGSLEVRRADASRVEQYADALPADVLLLCGIFGNVSSSDIQRTVRAAGAMCCRGGTVIWTRHRREPDLTPQIRSWFAAAGFEEMAFDMPSTATRVGVGVGRLLAPAPGERFPAEPLFTFGSG